MNPTSTLQLLLVRAVEETDPRGELLDLKERDRATEDSLTIAGPPASPSSENSITESQWAFLIHRAGILHKQAIAATGGELLPTGFGKMGTAVCLVAFLIGAVSHRAGLVRTFDLLAGPFVLILVWNLVVYMLLLLRFFRRPAEKNSLGLTSWLIDRRFMSLAKDGRKGGARKAHVEKVGEWYRSWAGSSLASCFHAGSVCFVVGLLAAIYFRGMYTGYVAAWESTWFDGRRMGSVLGAVLGPASIISGIALPGSPEAWEQLRRPPDHVGAPAGPWIHLYALTLLGWVVLPRLTLSLSSGFRARRLRNAPPSWRSDERYVARILSFAQQGGDLVVAILPFDFKKDEADGSGALGDGIERLAREAWGNGARPHWLPPGVYGNEDCIFEQQWQDARNYESALLIFDAQATPEPEVHGVLLENVIACFSPRRGVLVGLECARVAAARMESRIKLWQQLAGQYKIEMLPVEKGVARDTCVNVETKVFTRYQTS